MRKMQQIITILSEGKRQYPKILFLGFLLFFSYLMVLITIQYYPIRLDVAFLRTKQDIISKGYYQIAFFIHVFVSIFVLFFGMFQLSNTIRIKFPAIHKLLGKLYVVSILLLAGPTGLIMAVHANGGLLSKIGFSVLSILWLFFTWKAYQNIKQKKWKAHQRNMLRSYALTLSAITLRLSKWIITLFWTLPPMDLTKIISWLGWGLNLVLVELFIWKKMKN